MGAVYKHLHHTEKLGACALLLVRWRSRAVEFLLFHVEADPDRARLRARITVTAFCAKLSYIQLI